MADKIPVIPEPNQDKAIVGILDQVAKMAGMPTRKQAHADSICISCGRVITVAEFESWSVAGQREYRISGFCEPCFDGLFEDEDE